jgi:hypothetical protein
MSVLQVCATKQSAMCERERSLIKMKNHRFDLENVNRVGFPSEAMKVGIRCGTPRFRGLVLVPEQCDRIRTVRQNMCMLTTINLRTSEAAVASFPSFFTIVK